MNSALWESEWLLMITGLLGGTWPAWLRPFYASVTHPVRWVLAQPLLLLERITRTIQHAWYSFLSFPRTLLLALARLLEQSGQQLTRRLAGLARSDMHGLHIPRGRTGSMIRLPTVPRRTKSKTVRAHRGGHARSGLRVLRNVEDRCPYCFDVIKRNDPRGVKVCEVCGTPHHADCWAVTNKCQVPHLNT